LELRQSPEERHTKGDTTLDSNCTEYITQTGSVIWDGSVVLASYLVSTLVPCQRFLELGSGCSGLCGIAAIEAGLKSVVFSDRKCILTQLESNLERNHMHDCTVIEILWGEPRLDHLKNSFDVIAAADCVYDIDLVLSLLETVAFYLAIGGTAFFSYDTSVGRHAAYKEFRLQLEHFFTKVEPINIESHVHMFKIS